MVIIVLLLVELDTGQRERKATSQTVSFPEAISGGYRKEGADTCQGIRHPGRREWW